MPTDKELLQKALDALEAAYHPNDEVGKVMDAIRERLAQPDGMAKFEFQEYGPPNWGDSQAALPESDEDYEALANKQLASLKEAGKKTFEDAAVRALNKLYNAESNGISLKNITHPQTMTVVEDAEINPDSLETVEIDLPEPVVTQYKYIDAHGKDYWTDEPWEGKNVEGVRHLYTTPPQREWQSLTDEEIEGAIDEVFEFGLDNGNVSNKRVISYVRVIEAMLKEKNEANK